VKSRAGIAIGAWIAFLGLCILVIARADFSADLSAFLPRSPTPAQQVLVDELRDGVVSRLILIGIEGADREPLAAASRALASTLDGDPAFVYVANGTQDRLRTDGELLIRHRYLLSPNMTAARFTTEGLREALERQLDLLSGTAGTLVANLLPRDPTGEFMPMLERLAGQGGPARLDGAWFSVDGRRALLVAQTRAPGFDLDAQEQALARIRDGFRKAARESGATAVNLLLGGPAVFAVTSRQDIKQDATRFSVLGMLLVSAILLFVYRSPRVLMLTLLPVVSGALAGIAAVSLGFGSVHGITLAFGATLIGEAVDYAIYLFTNTVPGSEPRSTLRRIWPTLRLGTATSVFGFGAMLFSGFPGLAQLGLFSITGLFVALLVTRWVLPELAPAGYSVKAAMSIGPGLLLAIGRASRIRGLILAAVCVAAVWVGFKGTAVWDDRLSSLSPVSNEAQKLDQQMRNDLGAPDVGHLIVIRGDTEQGALEAAENLGARLQPLVASGALSGFDSPAAWLPSARAQAARRQAIPDPAVLKRNLAKAVQGTPFQPGSFAPFLEEAGAAAKGPLLTRADLAGTGLGIKVDALLAQRHGKWHAMMPLRGVSDVAAIRGATGGLEGASAVLLDLMAESDALYRDYRNRALIFSVMGAVLIGALLGAVLRSAGRTWDALAPLAAAVVVTIALLLSTGQRLNIFHLVALLLVVGVGSNYTLFFERGNWAATDRHRTVTSVLFCNLSTVTGFGVLGFASTPVLGAIGTTVAIGAFLSMAFAALMLPAKPGGTEANAVSAGGAG
jgi:predicted exporter